MIEKDIILTPEAIAEMVFEDWNSQTDLFQWSHQYIDLQYEKLYYFAVSLDKLDEKATKFEFCYDFDKYMNIIKENGIFGRIGGLAECNNGRAINKLFLLNNLAIYFQIKGKNLENYILEKVEASLPTKLLKNKKIELKYSIDKSKYWNYHDKSDNLMLHVYVKSKRNVLKKTIVLDTLFNL